MELTVSKPPVDLIDQYAEELEEYWARLQSFDPIDLELVYASLAAMSARAGAMRFQIVHNESRKATAFRTKRLDPFMENLEFQFKVWSRIQTVREFEFKMEGKVT